MRIILSEKEVAKLNSVKKAVSARIKSAKTVASRKVKTTRNLLSSLLERAAVKVSVVSK